MNRRFFLTALASLPFMKWVKPKRPKKITVYFKTNTIVRFEWPVVVPVKLDRKEMYDRLGMRV